MERGQKSILVWLAFVAIGTSVALLTAYALVAPFHGIRSGSALGPSFYRLLEDFGSLQTVFGPLGVLLVAGLTACAGLSGHRRHFQVMSCILILGMLASFVLLYFVAFDGDAARYSPWDMEPHEFRARAYPFFAWTIGALASGLGALLGISKLRGEPK
jgi:hypothetical protein